MKIINLRFLNRFCRKHIFSILIGFFTIFKKSNPSIIILSIILSLFGNKIVNNCDDNISVAESAATSTESDKKWSEILKKKLSNVFKKKDDNNDNNDNNVNKPFKIRTKTEEYSEIDDISENDNYQEINDDNITYNKNDIANNNTNLQNKSNISKNITKINVKVKNKALIKNNNEKWHECKIDKLYKNYDVKIRDDFKLIVSDSNKQLLIQNLRTYDNIDFYFKFHIAEYDSKKINDLMILKDIQSWMTNCTISNDDFKNICIPVYIIIKDHKTENEIMVFEIYKMFFIEKEEGIKNCFISKGANWAAVQEIMSILHNFGYVNDLLNGKDYDVYNLANNIELCSFLENLLSVYLLSNSKTSDVVYLDMNENVDNKETFDYLYHNTNSETNMIGIDTLTTI